MTRIDTANQMWGTFYTSPALAAKAGDLSAGFDTRPPVMELVNGCVPFPNNLVPLSRLDAAEMSFMKYDLTAPEVTFPGNTTGMVNRYVPQPWGNNKARENRGH